MTFQLYRLHACYAVLVPRLTGRCHIYLRAPKPGLKALVYFNNIGFKAVLGVSNKVLSRAKYAFVFGAY